MRFYNKPLQKTESLKFFHKSLHDLFEDKLEDPFLIKWLSQKLAMQPFGLQYQYLNWKNNFIQEQEVLKKEAQMSSKKYMMNGWKTQLLLLIVKMAETQKE